MITKHKLWFASLLALCLLTTAACVESKHALSDPDTSPQVPELYGLWTMSNASGDVSYVHIGAGVDTSVDPAQPPEAGLMQFLLVTHNGAAQATQPGSIRLTKPFGFRFFVTEIEGQSYATCVPDPEPGKPHRLPTGYFFLKYQLDGNRLDVWDMNNEATAAAIEAGKLGGTVEREAGRLKRVVITDRADKISKFLASGGAADVFPDSGKSTYERMK
ncbi:MAG: hypothetical protein KF708_14755 [Pirellulales bacterium]|nr:hypothetical protein [Pirellulales bacterium]